MAEELISQYIDQAAIRAQTDFFLKQLAQLDKAYTELSNRQVSFKGANNTKEFVASIKEMEAASKQAAKSQDDFAKSVVIAEKAQQARLKTEQEVIKTIQQEEKAEQERLKTAKLAEQQADRNTKAAEREAAARSKAAEVPFTHNLNTDGTVKEPALGNTTGSVVNDVEKAQIEGILTAKEYAAAQKGVSASFVESQSNASKYAVTQKEIDLALAQDKLNAQKRTAELKNQVREETAVKGSIEQRRAALIRLNTVYDNLSPQERNSAAGQRLQKITLGLTEQLKQLEAASGRAQRNVGNYPTNSFNGLKAQLKDVTDQYNNMSKAEQKSAEGKELKGKIDTISKSLKDFGETSTISFSKAYSGLRILANIIPGLGISGIFLLAGQAIAATVEWIKEAAGKVVDFAEKMKTLSAVNLKAIDSFGEQRSHVEGLTAVLRDGNITLDDKKRALQDLIALDPKYLNGLSLANINTNEGKKILKDYIDLLRRKAELEAAGAVQSDASKEVYKLEVIKDLLKKRLFATKTNYEDLTEEELKYVDKVKTSTGRINFTASLLNLEVPKSDIKEMIAGVDKELTKAGVKVTAAMDVFKDKFKAVGNDDVKLGIIESLKKQITDLDKQIDTETVKTKITGLVTARKDLQKQLDDLLGKEPSKKSGQGIKTISDAVVELRKELNTLDQEDKIGKITPKEADIERVKAYDKAFKEIFDRKGNANSPIVQKLAVEVDPISQRVIQAQLHDIISKVKKEPIELAPPTVGKVTEIDPRPGHEEEIKLTEEMLQRELALQQTASLKKQSILQEEFNNGKISKEQFEKGMLEIQSRYSKEAVAAQIKALSDEIAMMDAGTIERENAEKRLAELQLNYNKIVADDRKKKNDELVAQLQQIQEIANQFAELGSNIVKLATTKQKNQLQDLEDSRQKNYDQELARINSSTLSEAEKADKIKILEAKRQAQKDEYDRKNREIQQKQAKYDKDIAIMNIIMNTAIAVVKALPNIPLAILAGALGAANLAVAIATPIPRFKSGKLTDFEGVAYVGDGGKKEVITRADGSVELTPDKPTLTWIGKNDFVYPDVKAYTSTISTRQTDRIISNSSYGNNELASLFKDNNRKLDKVASAIKDMRPPKININAKHDPNFQIWVDKNVRGRR